VYSNHCRISEQPTFINLLHKESGFFILKKISLKKEGNEQRRASDKDNKRVGGWIKQKF
jgi:hypothetical protein